MTTLMITNASVVALGQVRAQHAVTCQDGRISWVGPSSQAPAVAADHVVDAQGRYLVPGFIDLHIHGTHEYLIDNGLISE